MARAARHLYGTFAAARLATQAAWDYERLASEDDLLTPNQRENLVAHAERCSRCAHQIAREDAAASNTEPGMKPD